MEVKEIALTRALAMLRSAGAQYVVKVGEDVYTHGDLKLAPADDRKRKQRVPMNTYKNVYEPALRGVSPEQSVVIPWGDLNRGDMQAACSTWCTKYWGKGNYLTHQTEAGLEVLRML